MSDDRKLVYDLFGMSYIKVNDLAERFITLTDEERSMQREKKILLILTRIRDEGKLDAFRTAVFEQKAMDDAK